jgi:hypothetical protein
MSLDLIVSLLGDLGLDPRVDEVRPYGWWETMEVHDCEPGYFPPELVEPLRAGLPGIAAIDSSVTWPAPGPFRVGTGDPLGGPWMQALGVRQL